MNLFQFQNGAFFKYFKDDYQQLKTETTKRFNRCSLIKEVLLYPDGLKTFHVITDTLQQVIVNKLIMRNLHFRTINLTSLT